MSTPPITTFTITLTPVPGDNRPPIYRLRAGLKYLLRVCGLRCVTLTPDVREVAE